MRVTDGWTDTQMDGIGVAYTCYNIYAVAHKKVNNAYAILGVKG